MTEATSPYINPPWRWFTFKRVDCDSAITVHAHGYSVEGTAAGWLVEFYEFIACYTDDAEDALVAQTRRSYAIPGGVTFEVIEEEQVPAAGARTH